MSLGDIKQGLPIEVKMEVVRMILEIQNRELKDLKERVKKLEDEKLK